jgi:26S proteasome regulatory subunit T3
MSAAAVAPTPPAAAFPMAPPPSYPAAAAAASASPAEGHEDDLYGRLKSLQRALEFVEIQEDCVKDELRNLRREEVRVKEEVKRCRATPLEIGQFMEMVDADHGIVAPTTGGSYYVRILSTIDREDLKPSASVALDRHSHALVDVLPPEADSTISLLGSSEKPNVTYNVSSCCWNFSYLHQTIVEFIAALLFV